MPERICLLTDQDLDNPPLPDDDWPCDPRPYRPEAEWRVLPLEKESCVADVIRAVRSEEFDLFFNLCDGAWDEGRVGIEVVETLEGLNVPFTGADSGFYEPSREAMKRACRAWDVHTPAYAVARAPRDIERVLDLLRFPMFVKHPSSYASNGLTRASRVEDREQLAEQIALNLDRFGSALVEEFIEGKECTVMVAENADDPTDPIVYAPLEYRFPDGETFKHYDLKWVNYDGLESGPVTDPALDAGLRRDSAAFFQGICGVGYGRCDVRVDRDGRIHMLEINPNCGVFYPPTDPGSADLILMRDPAGHAGFVDAVVRAAYARHRRRQRAWSVRPRIHGDYGIFANRSIAPGERVVVFEEQPHHLVTRNYVERNWGERQRSWFAEYAWPLTDEVWVIWSDDPASWRPVNHSCDPNAWIEGLDVVARRAIATGEEITLDYATFYDERMPSFSCHCGAARCRGTVRGDDFLLDSVARYGDHLSDHIARRRQERGS